MTGCWIWTLEAWSWGWGWAAAGRGLGWGNGIRVSWLHTCNIYSLLVGLDLVSWASTPHLHSPLTGRVHGFRVRGHVEHPRTR